GSRSLKFSTVGNGVRPRRGVFWRLVPSRSALRRRGGLHWKEEARRSEAVYGGAKMGQVAPTRREYTGNLDNFHLLCKASFIRHLGCAQRVRPELVLPPSPASTFTHFGGDIQATRLSLRESF